MPPAIDLTGHRFGKLVAVSRVSTDRGTGWRCRCDCGAETVVPMQRLASVGDDDPRAIRACESCRSRLCAICGLPYLKPGSATTCGASACRIEYRRLRNRAYHAAKIARDPDYDRARKARRTQQMRDDPEAWALYLEWSREYERRPEVIEMRRAAARARRREHRLTMTPAERAEQRAQAREYYAANRDAIRAYFRDWLAALPPDRRERWDADQRNAQVRYRRRRAMAQMMKQSQMLLERTPENDL